MHDFLLAKIFLFKEYLALDFGSLQVREVSVFYNRNARNRIKINDKKHCSENDCCHYDLAVYMLLKLSRNRSQFAAQTVDKFSVISCSQYCKYLVFNYIIPQKLLSVKYYKLCKSRSYKMLHRGIICVSYVIMERKRLPARKDNNSMAHLQTNRSK